MSAANFLNSIDVYDSPGYSLAISLKEKFCGIDMLMKIPCINTRELPHTFQIIKRELPSLLVSTCFNEHNLPFKEEVKHTEIGHLFEHIVLEYLCLIKLADGHDTAVYNGVTSWNWVKETRGTFHIRIDVPFKDKKYLKQALEKTYTLMAKLLMPIIDTDIIKKKTRSTADRFLYSLPAVA